MDGICYIVGSRPPGEIALARGREALVIAADGGLRHLEAQGLTADLIVGDFDSLGRVPEGDNILRHPVEKDDTDMLLAVRTGLDRGYRIFVLYGGLVMEEGATEELFAAPRHPYTLGLMDSIPRLDQDKARRLQPIPGSPPSLLNPPEGCPFRARCPYARNLCGRLRPETARCSPSHASACWLLSPEAPAEGNPFKGGKEESAPDGRE